MPETRDLTVLIPFYNEAGNIQPLLDEVHGALDGINYEVVCVNDCSSDSTAVELAAAKAARPDRVRVLTHVRRRGKSAALFTGLRDAEGRWVQLLDGDGQNDPADARRVWDSVAVKEENPALGIICGRRTSRNDSGFKWLQSRIANGVRRFCLKDDARGSFHSAATPYPPRRTSHIIPSRSIIPAPRRPRNPYFETPCRRLRSATGSSRTSQPARFTRAGRKRCMEAK